MIQKLTGWITPQRLQGNLNVVPSEVGGASLQAKTAWPSHSEQTIKPDDDYDGLALVVVKPVPRLPACVVSVAEVVNETVKNVVNNIAVGVSVTSGKWYTHFLYNGVRLPRIPDNVLAEYPYVWIRNDGANGNYNLVFGKQPWYFDPEPVLVCGDKSSLPYYSIPISSYSTATEWSNQKDGGGTNFGIASNRTVLWSNHDIPNGSATATDIYFAGSEPVPTD